MESLPTGCRSLMWTALSPQAKPIPSKLTGGTGGDHAVEGPTMYQLARSGACVCIRTGETSVSGKLMNRQRS